MGKISCRMALSCLAGVLVLEPKAQTQYLPEPRPSNTLLSHSQCNGEDEVSAGFRLLFDGTLASFQGNFANWKQNDPDNIYVDSRYTLCAAESTICTGTAAPDIRMRVPVADFDLRFTYRNDGNEGVFYKALLRSAFPWETGVEFTVEDNVSLPPKQLAGGAYLLFAPDPFNYMAYNTGRWNSVRIVAKGDSVEHWMNNVKVVGYRFWDSRWNSARANSIWATSELAEKTPGCKCPIDAGYIAIEGDHGGNWHLKNLRINSNPATVRLGPARCEVLGTERRFAAPSFAGIERLPHSIRIHFGARPAITAKLAGLNGKAAGDVAVEAGGTSALIRNWKRPGIYFLLAYGRDGRLVQREKLYLP